jgi:hypothetical protein
VKICFSPEAMAPQLAREQKKAIEDKKRDVRLQVIVALTTKPPQLTDPEFESAWAQIPEPEKASGAVNALAGRVIALARPR